jgi:hypothetical protein
MPPECFCRTTGDFDGQGISFGALQWNIGQGTLQPMLSEMIFRHRAVCLEIFRDRLRELETMLTARLTEQLSFARFIQDGRNQIMEPWQSMLKTLGRTTEFCEIQARAAAHLFARASALAGEYGLQSSRGIALMFDILTQNGSIGEDVRAEITRDFAAISAGTAEAREVARMRIIARRRAAAARPAFRQDVLARKMTIAEGAGTVHGIRYELDRQFGIGLERLSLAA